VNNTKTNTFGPAKSAEKNPFKARLKRVEKDYAVSIDPKLGNRHSAKILANKHKVSRKRVDHIRSTMGFRVVEPSKKQLVIDAHKSGRINLDTMTDPDVVSALNDFCHWSTVAAARHELGIFRRPQKAVDLSHKENNDLMAAWR
jgi:hypothetical protein